MNEQTVPTERVWCVVVPHHAEGARVAAEVRRLAQRTTEAAKEIKMLIQDAGQKVNDGATRVHQSGQTLEEIVAAVKRVTDIITEIATASVVMVCPEGKENRSGGRSLAQQWVSISHGRLRPENFLSKIKSPIPASAAEPAEASAAKSAE